MYWIYVCIWYVYRGECKCVLYHLVVWVSLQAGLFVGWSFKTAAALTVWVLGSSLSGWWVGLNSKWDGNEWRNICPVPNKDHPQIGWVSIRSISIYPYFSCMCSEKIEKKLAPQFWLGATRIFEWNHVGRFDHFGEECLGWEVLVSSKEQTWAPWPGPSLGLLDSLDSF